MPNKMTFLMTFWYKFIAYSFLIAKKCLMLCISIMLLFCISIFMLRISLRLVGLNIYFYVTFSLLKNRYMEMVYMEMVENFYYEIHIECYTTHME